MNTAEQLVPKEVKRLGSEGLEIEWSNGERVTLSSEKLRKNCPSADSKAERGDTSHDTPLTPQKSSLRVVEHTKDEQLELVRIWLVGNYAIGIEWGDGHKTGIYPFKLLYELSAQCSNACSGCAC